MNADGYETITKRAATLPVNDQVWESKIDQQSGLSWRLPDQLQQRPCN